MVAAGQQAAPGKIWDSNKTTLTALLTQRGIEYTDLGIARDDSDNVYNKLVEAFDRDVDVLITTGGVSMGERDVLKRILEVGFEAKVVFGTPRRPVQAKCLNLTTLLFRSHKHEAREAHVLPDVRLERLEKARLCSAR